MESQNIGYQSDWTGRQVEPSGKPDKNIPKMRCRIRGEVEHVFMSHVGLGLTYEVGNFLAIMWSIFPLVFCFRHQFIE